MLGKTFLMQSIIFLKHNASVSGLLIAFFAAWRIPGAIISEQLNTNDGVG